jgi:hypothetical protein
MLTLKWLIGLFCFLYPARVEGAAWETIPKAMAHADQKTCAATQALTYGHAT